MHKQNRLSKSINIALLAIYLITIFVAGFSHNHGLIKNCQLGSCEVDSRPQLSQADMTISSAAPKHELCLACHFMFSHHFASPVSPFSIPATTGPLVATIPPFIPQTTHLFIPTRGPPTDLA